MHLLPFASPALLPLHLLAIFSTLILRPTGTPKALAVLSILLTAPALHPPLSPDHTAAYAFRTTWTLTLQAVGLVCFYGCGEKIAVKKNEKKENGIRDGDVKKEQETRKDRITTAGNLILNQRLIHTTHEIRPLNSWSFDTSSRRSFLLHLTLRTAALYLLIDTAHLYVLQQAYHHDPSLGLGTRTLTQRVLDVFCYFVQGRCHIEMLYNIAAIVSVAVGVWSPDAWPPLFGRFPQDLTSLSLFWGTYWHQMLRFMFLTHNNALLSLFPPLNGAPRQIARIFTVFFISALGHAISTNALGGGLGAWTFAFHAVQAVGVSAEVLVGRVWRGGERGWGWKVLGVLWVAVWFVGTAPWELEEFVRGGLYTQEPLPWSFWGWVLK